MQTGLDSDESLQGLCFRRVALSLREERYRGSDFRSVPSPVVNELFVKVASATDACGATLLPLVRSGQMTALRLPTSSRISAHDFLLLCRSLEPFAASLTDVHVDAFCPRGAGHDRCSRAVGRLVAASRGLVSLRMSVPFDLRSLLRLRELRFLDVNAIVHKVKRSLFWEKCERRAVLKEVVAILEGCPHLLTLRNDLSGALDHISRSSSLPRCNTCLPVLFSYKVLRITLRFKLQSVVLGKAQSGGASLRHVQLAALVCPDLVDLELWICSDLPLLHAMQMRHLRCLRLEWLGSSVDFQRTFLPCLRSFGGNLKSLALAGFTNVVFDAFLEHAPDLEELEIRGMEVVAGCHGPTRGFPLLRVLDLSLQPRSCEDGVALYRAAFSRAPRLKRLRLLLARSPCDPNEWLAGQWPCLQHLSHLTLHKCRMSPDSYVSLVKSCPSLQLFHFSASPDLSTADVCFLRHSLLPSHDLRNLSFSKWKISRIA